MPRRYSTSTLIDPVICVPWLAAEGPLAYTPENPPATDYFFQYSWILPEIFNSKVHKRRHHYFGTPIRDHAKPLFEFWRQARRRAVDRVYLSLGSFAENRLRAPVAVYRAKLRPHDESDQWLFIQHGSYQWISSADQPHVEEGEVLLYRGIQQEETFRYPSLEQDLQQPANQRTWHRYLALQWSMLSDSSLSFNTIHDRTRRCETACLNDGTWLAGRLAAEASLDIESDRFAHVLWEAATSAFSLERWVAERKFGPHFVVAKTPVANIRLTTFFAGEAEVRLVDPSQIRVLESVGCTVATRRNSSKLSTRITCPLAAPQTRAPFLPASPDHVARGYVPVRPHGIRGSVYNGHQGDHIMRISTVREFRDKATGLLRSKTPILVTRRGRLAGIFFPRPEITLPIELKRELYDMLSSDVARQLKRRHVSEDEVLEDFEASRKKRRAARRRR